MTARRIGRHRPGGPDRKLVPYARVLAVLREVSAETGIPLREIEGRGRARAVVTARWEAWRRLCGPESSIASVARIWGCHWTTILNALNRLEERQTA